MNLSSSIKHLKLVTGEELVCELLEETPESILIRNGLALMPKTLNDGTKIFAFKTYMVYQDTPSNVIMIFTDKIVSIAVPADEMMTQYGNALREMAEFLETDEENRLEDDFNESLSLDDFLDEMDSGKDFIDSDVSGMAPH